MKKFSKKIGIAALAIALTSGAVLPLFAEEKDPKSNVSVVFTKPDTTDPVDPVDPTDPTKPLDPKDPEDGGETGQTGDLTIDYFPHFDFNEIKIDGNKKSATVKQNKPFVQVTDRRATGAGWILQAELKPFKNSNHEITDATITLKNGSVIQADEESTSGKPTTAASVVLSPNSQVDVMTAGKKAGLGTWLVAWLNEGTADSNDKVVLNINTKDALVGKYESEIDWTLAQQP